MFKKSPQGGCLPSFNNGRLRWNANFIYLTVNVQMVLDWSVVKLDDVAAVDEFQVVSRQFLYERRHLRLHNVERRRKRL